MVGSRDPGRAAAAVAHWSEGSRGIRTVDYGTAMSEADVVVLATPFEAVAALLAEHPEGGVEQQAPTRGERGGGTGHTGHADLPEIER